MVNKTRDHLFPVETSPVHMGMELPGGWHSVHTFSPSCTENACRTCASSPSTIQAAANALHQNSVKLASLQAEQTLRPFSLFQLAK